MDDYSNNFGVSSAPGGLVRVLFPPKESIEPEDALLLAAWLVAIAEHKCDLKFATVLEEVLSL